MRWRLFFNYDTLSKMNGETVTERKVGKSNHTKTLYGIGATLLILILGVLVTLFIKSAGNIPAELSRAQKSTSFPLLYPATVPTGFSFEKGSVSTTSNVVLYRYLYDGGKKQLMFSVQPKDGLDTSNFKPTSEFTTNVGRAYIVDLDDRTSAAIVGDESWLLINAPEKIAVDTLRQIINQLAPIK